MARIKASSRGSRASAPRKRGFKRVAIVAILLLVWSWIMISLGMLFYHGYYSHRSEASTGATSNLSGSDLQSVFVPGEKRHSSAEEARLKPHESPLLIFTCNRENYLSETLDDIRRYIPTDCTIGCPIIISQDGNKPEVDKTIEDYKDLFGEMGVPLIHLKHKSALRKGGDAYQALAVHYGWALGQVFGDQAQAPGVSASPQRVLILEEDLHVAPDFFSYFAATAPLLDRDSTLLAVSAFNDNGFEGRVRDPTRVLRSDFFPGLGWLMNRKLWVNELSIKWPRGWWDDWLREPGQRQGRKIIRPEISRTFHFGTQGGASRNQFGGRLSQVLLNKDAVDWSQQDLSHLQEDAFDLQYWEAVTSAQLVGSVPEALEVSKQQDVRLEYSSIEGYKAIARKIGLMDDEKAGIPRTAYRGVIETRPHGEHFLFITPPLVEMQKEFVGIGTQR